VRIVKIMGGALPDSQVLSTWRHVIMFVVLDDM
jgi:hypothetical protein